MRGGGADFLAHPVEPAGAGFQFGDADDVVIGHGNRDLARGFRGEGGVMGGDAFYQMQVFLDIG